MGQKGHTLHTDIRTAETLDIFYDRLKTYLFRLKKNKSFLSLGSKMYHLGLFAGLILAVFGLYFMG